MSKALGPHCLSVGICWVWLTGRLVTMPEHLLPLERYKYRNCLFSQKKRKKIYNMYFSKHVSFKNQFQDLVCVAVMRSYPLETRIIQHLTQPRVQREQQPDTEVDSTWKDYPNIWFTSVCTREIWRNQMSKQRPRGDVNTAKIGCFDCYLCLLWKQVVLSVSALHWLCHC